MTLLSNPNNKLCKTQGDFYTLGPQTHFLAKMVHWQMVYIQDAGKVNLIAHRSRIFIFYTNNYFERSRSCFWRWPLGFFYLYYTWQMQTKKLVQRTHFDSEASCNICRFFFFHHDLNFLDLIKSLFLAIVQ